MVTNFVVHQKESLADSEVPTNNFTKDKRTNDLTEAVYFVYR